MEYRVLARKYRPASFNELIGQDVLVRTLSNAIAQNRIHHAFVLTGIRGIGKTTTARIIAKSLNCEQGASVSPCGVCSHCTMIAESRHPDVIEMDAASRTGVADIRDLIEGVQYAPASARYKVYIIDEVHMLSTSAFNALLKTLEEPPPHVKFIFATTEARKIPVTILSRCQRFDLKRLDTELLATHLGNVAQKEGAGAEQAALTLIAQAAEGSVRDALSLLDQAMAQAEGDISEPQVRGMLGLADKGHVAALFRTLAEGDVPGALGQCRALYAAGADPLMLLQDMLDFTHFVTRLQLTPQLAQDVSYGQQEREEAAALAKDMNVAELALIWQMLLKAVNEARYAPSPLAAVEMALVRIAYAADLPTPLELHAGAAAEKKTLAPSLPPSLLPPERVAVPAAQNSPPPVVESAPAPVVPPDFSAMVVALEQAREMLLASQLRQFGSVVAYAPGALSLHMQTGGGREFAGRLAEALQRITGMEWKITFADAPGAPTLHAQGLARKEQQKQDAAAHPLVESVLKQFPGAEIVDVREMA